MPERDIPCLKVYSAWVPALPLKEAAAAFERSRGIRIQVVAGCPESWMPQLRASRQGDLISCGAQFLLDEAEMEGIVAPEGRRELGRRRAAIVVRVGNPLGIRSIEDLARPGVRVGIASGGCTLGMWDEIASRAGLTSEIRRNVVERARGCCALMQGIIKGRTDAILGWANFPQAFPGELETVPLPEPLAVQRTTGIAATTFRTNGGLVEEFLNFLTRGPGREIYRKWGWMVDGEEL
jgi:molybdate transport system substrate-binding protein